LCPLYAGGCGVPSGYRHECPSFRMVTAYVSHIPSHPFCPGADRTGGITVAIPLSTPDSGLSIFPGLFLILPHQGNMTRHATSHVVSDSPNINGSNQYCLLLQHNVEHPVIRGGNPEHNGIDIIKITACWHRRFLPDIACSGRGHTKIIDAWNNRCSGRCQGIGHIEILAH
jgi:hypothetical protein